MATDFKFPDLGEGVTEGEIKRWLVKEGDEVRADQSLAEVETDKAVVEMPSPIAGKVLKLYHKEGEVVMVGEVLVTLGAEGEAIPIPSAAPPLEVKEERRPSVSVVGELPEGEIVVSSRATSQATAEGRQVLATPAVRKLARDLNVELSSIRSTGPEGRVTEADVKAAAEQVTRPAPRKVAKFDLYGYVDREPVKGIRRSTAKKMVESSQHAAMVTMMDDADVTELVAIREKLKVMAKEERNVHLTYLPFIIKAVVMALKANRYLNASYDDETEEIVVKKYYNIGIAVAIDEGLLVPVIKAADQKEIMDLAAEIGDIIAKSKERKVDLADLKGGTFTITNYGTMAGTYGTPIINYPESTILGVGRIRDMPWVHEGKVKVRKIMPLSITWDHRIMDGAQVAKFMGELIRSLEDPDIILAMH